MRGEACTAQFDTNHELCAFTVFLLELEVHWPPQTVVTMRSDVVEVQLHQLQQKST
jgi:hypothetical protein